MVLDNNQDATLENSNVTLENNNKIDNAPLDSQTSNPSYQNSEYKTMSIYSYYQLALEKVYKIIKKIEYFFLKGYSYLYSKLFKVENSDV